jgi:hypothetical protein
MQTIGMWMALALASVLGGCESISPVGSDDPVDDTGPAASPPTYHADVAPILEANCLGCHGEGQVATLLDGHASASVMARQIVDWTASDLMPPWSASDACVPLVGKPSLGDADKATLAAWADAGAPEGEPTSAEDSGMPAEGDFTVDLTVSMPEPFIPEVTAADEYRCFVVDPGLTEDVDVTAFRVAPGNARIVHHVLLFGDPNGEGVALDEADPEPGYACFGDPGFDVLQTLGIWAPGMDEVRMPEGTGIPISAGSKLILQVHYFPANDPGGADQSVVELELADDPVISLLLFPFVDYELDILAGEADHVESFSYTLDLGFDLKVWGAGPHMHLLGTSLVLRSSGPEAEDEDTCIIDIPKWDFEFQRFFFFEEPYTLRDGSTLEIECHYDNSEDNPNQPNDPPQDVNWGDGTEEEMCLVYMAFSI